MIRRLAVVGLTAGIGISSATGCVNQKVSDKPAPNPQILPAGSTAPSADDDPQLGARIAQMDGLKGVLPRRSGFAGGVPVLGWDFGVALAKSSPMYILVEADGTPVDHPPIVLVAPGDANYSQFWSIWNVTVTEHYNGELITSIDALNSAYTLGLVGAPVIQMIGQSEPIVGNDVSLDLGGGAAPMPPNDTLFYEGFSVHAYKFNHQPIKANGVTITTAPRYSLTRMGEVVLNEITRGVDIDGDGDKLDTNDIYGMAPNGVPTTNAFQSEDVTIKDGTEAIDTLMDQTMSAITKDSDLFMGTNPTANVVAFTVDSDVRNIQIQTAVGSL